MFSKILTSALFAGFAAGLIAALAQIVFVQPMLLQAELFESGALVHFGPTANDIGPADAQVQIDMARDGLSILFTTLVYTGYSFILVAAMAIASERGVSITPRQGLLWGLCGFLAFQFAPAIGLPPELPGSLAAEIGERQIWWHGTAIATALALALLAFGRKPALWVIAALLLVLPHVVGAPMPVAYAGPVPPELTGLFAGRALGLGLFSWGLLGFFAAWLWSRDPNKKPIES